MRRAALVGTVEGMADIDHQGRPGAGLAGFAVTVGLLLVVAFAWYTHALAGAGWSGGEYANTFVAIALGAVLVGTVLAATGTRWRRFGIGVLAGGGLGVAFVVVVFAVVMYALSRLTF